MIFGGANLSKYLIAETKKPGRVLLFLKPCRQLQPEPALTEHRVAREKVYAVAISCDGMTDADLLAKAAETGSCRSDGRTTVSSLRRFRTNIARSSGKAFCRSAACAVRKKR